MIKEFFVLSRKKIFKYLLILIVLCVGITSKPIQTSSEYDNFYNKYSNKLEFFETNGVYRFTPECKERDYLIGHIVYLTGRHDNIASKVEMLEKQLNSSLFVDDSDKLNNELTYQIERLNADVKFYDTYKNEIILNNDILIYCLYIIGIILVISIFYDDIKNGQLQIFKTYKNNLKNIFKFKLLSFLSIMTISTITFMCVEMIQLNGNYSVYNIKSLSETFMNLNLISYIAVKYMNVFVNAILFSIVLITVLQITRNLVVTMISSFLGMLVSFFAYSTTMSNFKYFNLFYFMFADKLQYNGINTTLSITKLCLCILFIILFYLIYVKDFSIDIFKKSKKVALKTTNSILHILRELLIPSKGILAITIVLLFSIYQFNTFKMSLDYKEVSYQEFKKQYLGSINEKRYKDVLDDYEEIQKCYEKSLMIWELVEENPEKAGELLIENDVVLNKARNLENIGRLRVEFEEAMSLELDNLVDDRGANLLVMKDKEIYLIECLSILALPLIFVYMSFRKLMRLPSYSTVIKTSKSGEKKYLLLSNVLFTLLVILNTFIMIIGHIIKIEKYYPLDLSYTLKDILFANIGISLSTTLVIFGVGVVLGIILISKLSYFIINNIYLEKFNKN